MHKYLSTPPIFSAPVANIDREQGIIQGVTIAQVGPAKGHDGFIDQAFLLQIVDNAVAKTAGIKARFGHPNMCSSALGTYLGRFKNYSYSGDQVKADLHLDETAKSTPSGDLFTYILNMAEKNPDMFGASIVFEIADSVFLQEEAEGKVIDKEYFRLKELRATDIVDEPAATDGLFSARWLLSGAEAFPGIATQFLDENPEILELIFSKPDSVTEFLSNYLTNSKMNLSDKLKQNFSAFLAAFTAQSPGPQELNADLQTLIDEHQTLTADHQSLAQEHTALSTELQALRADLQGLSTEHQAMTASFETLNTEHQALINQHDALSTEHQAILLELDTERSRSAARPSIPLNVTDPAISLSGTPDKDETGKQILASMPKDMKRKLASNIKSSE